MKFPFDLDAYLTTGKFKIDVPPESSLHNDAFRTLAHVKSQYTETITKNTEKRREKKNYMNPHDMNAFR